MYQKHNETQQNYLYPHHTHEFGVWNDRQRFLSKTQTVARTFRTNKLTNTHTHLLISWFSAVPVKWLLLLSDTLMAFVIFSRVELKRIVKVNNNGGRQDQSECTSKKVSMGWCRNG